MFAQLFDGVALGHAMVGVDQGKAGVQRPACVTPPHELGRHGALCAMLVARRHPLHRVRSPRTDIKGQALQRPLRVTDRRHVLLSEVARAVPDLRDRVGERRARRQL